MNGVPSASLAGEWEGDQGIDISYHNVEREIGEIKYREKTSLKPFGPVDNGPQHLYGLDYRMAVWRGEEENPFHTEIGYWLWDAAAQQVIRCVMVPRGSMYLAGGSADAGDKSFYVEANCGAEDYGILSNKYLAENARTSKFSCTIQIVDDNNWSYDEMTVYNHVIAGEVGHRDTNTLRRVD